MCTIFKDKWYFSPHDGAFSRRDPDQDRLWKFSMPATERSKVLRILDSYNLNSFSLFGSEESLMDTLSVRAFDFKEDI